MKIKLLEGISEGKTGNISNRAGRFVSHVTVIQLEKIFVSVESVSFFCIKLL